jgi:hypothetical protein
MATKDWKVDYFPFSKVFPQFKEYLEGGELIRSWSRDSFWSNDEDDYLHIVKFNKKITVIIEESGELWEELKSFKNKLQALKFARMYMKKSKRRY